MPSSNCLVAVFGHINNRGVAEIKEVELFQVKGDKFKNEKGEEKTISEWRVEFEKSAQKHANYTKNVRYDPNMPKYFLENPEQRQEIVKLRSETNNDLTKNKIKFVKDRKEAIEKLNSKGLFKSKDPVFCLNKDGTLSVFSKNRKEKIEETVYVRIGENKYIIRGGLNTQSWSVSQIKNGKVVIQE